MAQGPPRYHHTEAEDSLQDLAQAPNASALPCSPGQACRRRAAIRGMETRSASVARRPVIFLPRAAKEACSFASRGWRVVDRASHSRTMPMGCDGYQSIHGVEKIHGNRIHGIHDMKRKRCAMPPLVHLAAPSTGIWHTAWRLASQLAATMR